MTRLRVFPSETQLSGTQKTVVCREEDIQCQGRDFWKSSMAYTIFRGISAIACGSVLPSDTVSESTQGD